MEEFAEMVVAVVAPKRSLKETVLPAYRGQLRHRSWRPSGPVGGGVDPYDEVAEDLVEEIEEGNLEMVQLGAERPKNVLILMSDTGGGHRASAEAIREAFRLEFGGSIGKVEAGLRKYKPDIIISVHPLMQHIPLWVLKWKSRQKAVPFFTVITDLKTCHRTWFHNNVTRCYCPSEEVAKRALLDGLDPSQIGVFGLPIRPSFCRAILHKDELREELRWIQTSQLFY
ncbi:hypothetical protein HPP92_003855 [Vanilla planifolia]|uniref:Diacylglycerol glucosyltransferase N-terminal domain-containing protein n=1 Tax=Vanilla planifolia TaxID=51239 RepID=A0A835VFW5_VANPL|nr:hypothetical protein HPP92_003855 [Vanilla planifolia]